MKVLNSVLIFVRKQWAILSILALSTIFMWRVVILGQVMLPLDAIYSYEPWLSEMPEVNPNPIWNPLLTDTIWEFYPQVDRVAEVHQKGGYFWDPNILSGSPAQARGELYSSHFFNVFRL
jgi:hypothetical protein